MRKNFLYALIVAVIFSALEPVSKIIARQINPYAITFLRVFIGASDYFRSALQKVGAIGISTKIFLIAVAWVPCRFSHDCSSGRD